MRNEIFKQISQNRIQYYTELKSNQKEFKPKKDSLQIQTNLNWENSKISEGKDLLLHQLKKFDFSNVIKITTSILLRVSNFTSRITHWLRGINEHITQKVATQSNKITDSLSKVSSQLFEDSYEFNSHLDLNAKFEQSNDNQKIAFSLVDSSGAALAVAHQQDGFRFLDQFINWLLIVYRSMILFLESDYWFEEIHHSQNSSELPRVKNIIIVSASNKNKIEVFIKSILQKRIRKISMNTENTITDNRYGNNIYKKISHQLKMILSTIFPSINRFIDI